MINTEIFLFGLVLTSVLTGLVTEAIKSILIERNINYRPNTLAGVIATVLSIFICIGYVIFTNSEFTSQIVICLIAQVFLSWLCAMVGYDKVIQSISQFKMAKKGETDNE